MDWRKKFQAVPAKPGVYLFKDRVGQVLYVGKSVNLKARLSSYLGNLKKLGPKTRLLLSLVEGVEFILVDSEIEALLLESALIKKHLPKFNLRSKDDKSPLYIRITGEEFPKVLVSRRLEDEGNDWLFGPFPSSRTVKNVLKFLRKIFPYCSCRENKGRPCLYAHIGLCRPSPRRILKLKPAEARKEKRKYRKNIKNLVKFLKGEKDKLINSLEKEMKKKGRFNLFEEAGQLRDQIQALLYITRTFRLPKDYLKNPNLLADRRRAELDELFKVLKSGGLLIEKKPGRIEAFDVSDLAGKKATGSMVTFINGEPEKNFYRRFKIKREARDDSQRLAEVLKRRFKHLEWGKPDLVIVDGGKPQVSAGKRFFDKKKIRIPLMGLAKKNEEIIFVKKGRFKILRLAKDSAALFLIQRVRDEAHRFAIAYHRSLRRKIID